MTQNIQPNMNSDLTQSVVRSWLQAFASGVLEGFDVTPGASGFQINIASGKVMIDGSPIHDDLTRTNLSLLTHVPGFNEHHVVYAQYTPQETFPPPAMTIGVIKTSAASPAKPAAPSIPADAVKLADIFVDTAAVTWGSGTQIINTPKLPARGLGANDVLLDRLINSNASIIVGGGGALTYDGVDELTWTAPFSLIAPVVTARESYFTAATASGSIPAGTLGPSPVVGPNSLIFTVFDRRTPNAIASPVALAMHVLNLDNPDPTERALFFNATTREQIVMIASIIGGVLRTRGDVGLNLPPPAAEPPPKVLHVQGGVPVWDSLNDNFFTGGLQTVADVTARNAIDATQRKQGMVVYVQSEDEHYVLAGGLLDANWAKYQDDNRITGGMRVIEWDNLVHADVVTALNALIPSARRKVNALVHVRNTNTGLYEARRWNGSTWIRHEATSSAGRFGIISGCAITNPDANTIRIATGEFYQLDGIKIVVDKQVDIDITSLNGTRSVIWDASANSGQGGFALGNIGSVATAVYPDLVFGFVVRDGTYVTRFLDLRPTYSQRVGFGQLFIGPDNNVNFTGLKKAMAWVNCYDDDVGVPRVFRIIDSFSTPTLTTLTTVAAITQSGSNGNVAAVGARFKRDLAVGDMVRISSANYFVTAITDDENMVIANWPTPGTTSSLTIQRCDLSSSYAESIDFNQPEFPSSVPLHQTEIIGTNWSETGTRPNINWGASSYPVNRPFFNLIGRVEGFSAAGFQINYNGAKNANVLTRHDTCFIKGLKSSSRFRDVIFDGNNNITHAVNISHDIGGDNSVPPTLFEECTFLDVSGLTTSPFFVSARVNGKFTVRKCEFETGSVDYDHLIEFGKEFTPLDIVFDDCEIDSVFDSVVLDYSDHRFSEKRFDNCRFGDKQAAGGYRVTKSWVQGGKDDVLVGTGATVSAVAAGEATIVGLSGMSTTQERGWLELGSTGTGLDNNRGVFLITEFISASSVKIWNPAATVNATGMAWQQHLRSNHGVAASIGAVVADEMTVTGLFSMGTDDVGKFLYLAKTADQLEHGGRFRITEFVSSTSVKVANPCGLGTDANNGSIVWSVNDEDSEPYRCELSNCSFAEDIDFSFTKRLSNGCKFIVAKTYTLGNDTTVVDCDLELGTPTSDGDDETFGTFDARGIMRVRRDANYLQSSVRMRDTMEWLQGFQYFGHEGSLRPHVGFRLFPTVIKSGSDYHTGASFDAGYAIWPNGKLGWVFLGDDIDLNVVREIDGSSYFPNHMYYFFLRYNEAVDGGFSENIDAIVYSSVPPDSDGSLGSAETPEGGYAKEDYLYIGVLFTGPKVAGTTPDEPDELWGHCRVIHENTAFGPKRRVFLSEVAETSLYNWKLQANSNVSTGSQQNLQPVSLPGPTLGVSGSAATIASRVNSIMTITGLSGILTSHVGKLIRLTGTGSPFENNGYYQIIERVSSSSVKVISRIGVSPDANDGSIGWELFDNVITKFPTTFAFGMRYIARIFNITAGAARIFMEPPGVVQGGTSSGVTTSQVRTQLTQDVVLPRMKGPYKPRSVAVIGNPTDADCESEIYINFIDEYLTIPEPDEVPNTGEDF